MQENLEIPLIRSSKKIKKNYKKMTLLTFHQEKTTNLPKKSISIPNLAHHSHQPNMTTTRNLINSYIQYYPQPIQGMLKLKKKLSMLDINTITQVLRNPDHSSLENMEIVALAQEKVVQGVTNDIQKVQKPINNFCYDDQKVEQNEFIEWQERDFEILMDRNNIDEGLRECEHEVFSMADEFDNIFK